jgi:stringent starvation protein B
MEITSNRPYLIRALYEWLVDNSLTPHLLVDAEGEGAVIPLQYVEDGRIVLNIAPSAVRTLELGNDFISFSARFGGVPTDVVVPTEAVLGIYARENGHGMLFPQDEPADGFEDSLDDDPEPPPPQRPTLKVVK